VTVVLVAHGSADPRAAVHTRALARLVGAVPAFLDHAGPRPGEVLFALERAGHRSAVLVPLLFTAAYHGRVDIPAAVSSARADGLDLDVTIAGVLGPMDGDVPPELLDALSNRLAGTFDGLVLAAAGTRDAAARETVSQAATALGERFGVPCVASYATSAGPRPGEAVALLRAAGCGRVGVSAYFVAPGRLYDAAAASSRAAGAVAVADPLGADPALARLVRRRATEALLVPA
jgi:sirohydrochlorin ferrochelatase